MSVDFEGSNQREELLTGDDHYRLLIDGIRDYAVFILDPEGHVMSWNNGAEQARALEGPYRALAGQRPDLKPTNEDLESSTYSVSHDLRAPIHHIGGFARLPLEEYGTAASRGTC